MMPEESIIDAVNRLEAAVNRLEVLVKGDNYSQFPGIAHDVRQLQLEMAHIKSIRTSTWQWLIGFMLFVGGTLLSNCAANELLGASSTTRFSFAGVLWAISAVFFLSGLGLIRWK